MKEVVTILLSGGQVLLYPESRQIRCSAFLLLHWLAWFSRKQWSSSYDISHSSFQSTTAKLPHAFQTLFLTLLKASSQRSLFSFWSWCKAGEQQERTHTHTHALRLWNPPLSATGDQQEHFSPGRAQPAWQGVLRLPHFVMLHIKVQRDIMIG